ncbi:MAG: hypothetical protein VX829_07770 [Pseudomonadota bacterium]|jgi:hypothetical protein|uniref:Uncharacterized protein n=2 Tax=Methylophaga TaxID=40222 RepID=F5SWA4_9GAMM|nr:MULTISPECIES: hypothetical protein [Methylophaga]EGL56152.1 hypothetical protein MAMP_03146 [Methylophaga aminisulfidivorans MP]MEC9412560.1 hypothetical protein [Pseudomonadota bacterium]WVI86006.1 hypothetical protein VSX76_05175 [Methylophaga thalassica]GLP98172.1 hypothetical protein GCM10007891_00260 [Methylophaga thalassica]
MSDVTSYSADVFAKGEEMGTDTHLFSVAKAATGVIEMVNGLKQIEAGK